MRLRSLFPAGARRGIAGGLRPRRRRRVRWPRELHPRALDSSIGESRSFAASSRAARHLARVPASGGAEELLFER
jgi:hypothetical protein